MVQPDGYNLSVGEFKYVPSLLTCPNLVDLMVHFLGMMMPAALVVVSLFLLMRVCGSAPSLLPWRAGNCGGFPCVSALGSTQSIWRIKGEEEKERNCFYGSSAFCFSQASFSAVASAMMVPLVFSAAPDVAAAFVYLFSDALVRGFASVFFLTLGVAFDIRSCVAASLFFLAATWCAALWEAALVYKFSDAFVHDFVGFLGFWRGLRHLKWCSSFSVLLQAHKHGSCVGICRHIRPSLPGVCCWYQECCAISWFPWDPGLWACSGTSDQGHATCFVDKTHSFGCARPIFGPAAV